MKIDGGCHCGFIRYEADVNPDSAAVCHCTDCQTLTGTAFRVVVPVADDTFRLVSGEPKTYIKTAESGAKRPQAFCPECGTPIYSTSLGEGPKILMVRVGTIRQRAEFRPTAQYWFRSAQPWITDLPSIRRIATH